MYLGFCSLIPKKKARHSMNKSAARPYCAFVISFFCILVYVLVVCFYDEAWVASLVLLEAAPLEHEESIYFSDESPRSSRGVSYVDSVASAGAFDVLVVGAGLSGAVIAERYSSAGYSVLVVEKRDHVAGNCYDYIDERTGIRVNKHGAHLFHTKEEKIWEYVTRFGDWIRFDHRVQAFVDGKYVPVPVNINTVNALFNGTNIRTPREMEEWMERETSHFHFAKPRDSEEMALSRVGARLYAKIFKPYTQKQWDRDPSSLDSSVTGRIPVHHNFDDRYFSDRFQALPVKGYTEWVESLLSHELIKVCLKLNFSEVPAWAQSMAKKIFYTGPIDSYFGEEGSLQYRSLRFERIEYLNHIGYVQTAPVVNYPSLEFPFTRVVEYKQLPLQASNHSVLFREYPSAEGEPYYPIPTAENRRKYENLSRRISASSKKTVFVGRLANYKYFNMDDSIKNSLQVFWNETRRVHVVIAKFKESLHWVRDLCAMLKRVRVAWFVYLKNPAEDTLEVEQDVLKLVALEEGCSTDSVTVIDHRHNVGREGLAWAEYAMTYGLGLAAGDVYKVVPGEGNAYSEILKKNSSHAYEMLSGRGDLTKMGLMHVFLQGHAEADLSSVARYVNGNIFRRQIPLDMESFHPVYCDREYEFTPAVFFYEEYLELVVNRLNWTEAFCYGLRGEFAVTHLAMERFAKLHGPLFESYVIPKLRESNDPYIGHLLERLWVFLFLPPPLWSAKYSSILHLNHFLASLKYEVQGRLKAIGF